MPYTLRRPAAAAAAGTRAPGDAVAAVIAEGRFVLAVQPVVGASGRTPDHIEALLRPPASEGLSPRAFVAAAEAAGLGPALDRAVLLAARALAGTVSVNVCARSLQQRDFVRAVLDAGAGAIELVRAETVDDLAAVAGAVTELRACGVRVALDAVDGGAASLALAQAARFDTLKLSGGVVRAAIAGARGRRLLGELLRLAEALGARVIATQIETLPQLWAMQREGVDLVQGWLLGAPALPPAGDAGQGLGAAQGLP